MFCCHFYLWLNIFPKYSYFLKDFYCCLGCKSAKVGGFKPVGDTVERLRTKTGADTSSFVSLPLYKLWYWGEGKGEAKEKQMPAGQNNRPREQTEHFSEFKRRTAI